MNRKKIENWVIFGLKLLPFLMLVIFAIHIHRHELPESIEIQSGYILDTAVVGTVYDPQILTVDNLYPSVGWSTSYRLIANYGDYDTTTIYYNLTTMSFVGPSIPGFVKNYSDRIEIYVPFTIQIVNSNVNEIKFKVPANVTYTEPLDIISGSFINYLSNIMNFNLFNINGFYNWSVNFWFNNNPPLIYKPVFIILVYELLVDLLVLMYSFITFVIKFAQKWLNGIYNKDW